MSLVRRNLKNIVRERILIYDNVGVFPALGIYGNLENREWKQYFISDTNDVSDIKCPFKVENKMPNNVIFKEGNPTTLERSVRILLPDTGSVEVQRDTPYREHKAHMHPTNETLLIVNGDITFTVEDRQITCTSGDRILLPVNTMHSSIAGETGCIYVIALEFNNKKVA